jgi:hypothetical protein
MVARAAKCPSVARVHVGMSATVRRIEMMLADGTVMTCSPTENEELFKLAMGGYGLVGIILKLEVELVENLLLKPTFEAVASEAFAPRFMAAVDPTVRMLYGRLNVARSRFFREAAIVAYRPHPCPPNELPAATAGGSVSSLSRKVYRAQVGSEAAKRALAALRLRCVRPRRWDRQCRGRQGRRGDLGHRRC